MQMEQGNNLPRVKVTNQSAIFRMIYYFGPIKRAEIAKKLGLTLPTITTNVNNMIADGIVREVCVHGPDHKRYGRKARMLEIVPGARHFIGIETTGVRRAVSIVDYGRHEVYSYCDTDVCVDYDKNMEKTCAVVCRCLEQCQLTWKDIFGVCIGLPGLVDRREGILNVHPRNKWNNKNIRADFKRLTGYEGTVNIENNACVRARGIQLYRREFLGSVQSFAYLFVDTGIACPLIVNRTHYSGSVVGAGEVGHMIMERNGLKCTCGNRGCLEAYSSDHAVISRCTEAMEQGKAERLREICNGCSAPGMSQILQAQREGDKDVQGIVENAIGFLAVAAANIINFTNPDNLLIDCKLFNEDGNRRHFMDVAEGNLCNKFCRGTEFVFVEPSNTSGARGAAAVAIHDDLESLRCAEQI